jgi:predicted peptidase
MESKNNNLKDLIVSGSYTAFIKGDDWGCGVNKILLSLDHKIDQVNNLSFVVKEKKLTTDYCDTLYPIIESIIYRTVTNVYLVDYSGQITSEPSNFIMIEMKISPAEGNPLLFSMQTQYNTYNDLYELDIMIADGHEMTSLGQKVKQINIAKKMKDKITSADLFEEALYESCDGVSYKYAAYNPVQASDTLVVWLHGLGEGGTINTDSYITVLANKVSSLAGQEFQNTIGGANILVPQCPTFWMDKTGDSLATKFTEADGTSYYCDSLHELINFYRKETKSEKVIITGCSNGGYMTMLMALKYGKEYNAYVPICEAFLNEKISDEEIKQLKKLPIFFIYSRDDDVVAPETHELPTIRRLLGAGASNVHTFVSKHVIDTSGRFNDKDGEPLRYSGHWSWIYFFSLIMRQYLIVVELEFGNGWHNS